MFHHLLEFARYAATTRQRDHGPAAYLYASKLYETARCDQFYDFSSRRKEFETFSSRFQDGKALERVLKAEQDATDEDIMQRTLTHYYTWHLGQLEETLTFTQKCKYYLNLERVFAIVGFGAAIGGPGIQAVRWARQRHAARAIERAKKVK